jgi:hypothetical protein
MDVISKFKNDANTFDEQTYTIEIGDNILNNLAYT